MSKLVVPRWFILAKTARAGIRLDRKIKFVQPYQAVEMTRVGVGDRLGSATLNLQNIKTATNEIFNQSDFRYWSVYLNEFKVINKAVCRSCGTSALSHWARKQHMDSCSCGRILVDAYELLNKDGRCVICDEKTSKKKWGVPLCNDHCVDAWCFWATKPQCVESAIGIIKANKNATT